MSQSLQTRGIVALEVECFINLILIDNLEMLGRVWKRAWGRSRHGRSSALG